MILEGERTLHGHVFDTNGRCTTSFMATILCNDAQLPFFPLPAVSRGISLWVLQTFVGAGLGWAVGAWVEGSRLRERQHWHPMDPAASAGTSWSVLNAIEHSNCVELTAFTQACKPAGLISTCM